MSASDDLGRRGESLCHVLLTKFCGRTRPYFNPQFLGDKFASLDFLVELIGSQRGTPYFFVQVKATRAGYQMDGTGQRRLKVKVSRRDVQRLKQYPGPTYVIGIDEPTQTGFVVSVDDDCPNILTGLPTTHELNCANLRRLWQEVDDYWRVRDMMMKASAFRSE